MGKHFVRRSCDDINSFIKTIRRGKKDFLSQSRIGITPISPSRVQVGDTVFLYDHNAGNYANAEIIKVYPVTEIKSTRELTRFRKTIKYDTSSQNIYWEKENKKLVNNPGKILYTVYFEIKYAKIPGTKRKVNVFRNSWVTR